MANNGVYTTPEIPDITEIEKARLHETAETEKVKLQQEGETKRLEISQREITRRTKMEKWSSDSFLTALAIIAVISVISLSLCIYHTTVVVMEHVHPSSK